MDTQEKITIRKKNQLQQKEHNLFRTATTATAKMDLDDFRAVLESCGVDVWTFIDTAIEVASLDYGGELKHRRDGIVERLYSASSPSEPRCRNCDDVDDRGNMNGHEVKATEVKDSGDQRGKSRSPATPQSVEREDAEDLDLFGGLFDDEQKKILEIKEQLEDLDQVTFFIIFTNCFIKMLTLFVFWV